MPLVKQAVLHTIIQVSFVSFYALFSSSCSRVYCVDVVALHLLSLCTVFAVWLAFAHFTTLSTCVLSVCAREFVYSRVWMVLENGGL